MANVKYKLGGYVYKNQFLKLDIEEYWISYTTHLSSIVCDSMRKNYEWFLNKGKRTGYKINHFNCFYL